MRVIKILYMLALLAMLTSCATTPRTSEYMLLSDGSIHPSSETPGGFFVRGRFAGSTFIPDGNVEGSGELARDGLPGWVELTDRRFYGDMVARPPFPAYVRGYRGSDGKFRPSTREVVYR